MRFRHLLALLALVTPLAAQGSPYAFADRKPRTRLETLIDEKLPSLVKIHGASGLSTIDPYATGVIVSADGYVLTLDLVMIQPGQTRVVLADGSVHDAELLPPEPELGVRLLKIDTSKLKAPLVPLEPSAAIPENGTFVVSIGNCFRLAEFSEKLSATFGVVTATATTGLRYRLQDVEYDGRLILTDAPNNPGQFGGGLFTLNGDWVGLNARIVESKETNTLVSAAIPAGELKPYLDRWVRGIVPATPDAPPPEPGVHGIVLFDHGGRRSPPAYIERVRRGSPAREAGLKPDDLIVRIGERAIRTCAEFGDEMAKHTAGETIEITYKRGTEVHKASFVLAEPKKP